MGTIRSTQEQQQWQALLDSAGEGIWGLDLEGTCTFVNRRAAEILGYTADEMVGENMHDMVHHHYADGQAYPAEDCSITAILKGMPPFRQMLDTMFRRDGSAFEAEVSAQPVLDGGAVAGVVVTFRDVSALLRERQELERAHREAEKRTAELVAVIESMPDGVYVATLDGAPMRLNQKALAMSGESFPDVLTTMEKALHGETANDVIQEEGRWLRSTAAPILLNGELIGGVAVNSDVTQTRLQDEALRRSEKLAAVGQLASSIAHEINNPLESITNLLYLIRQADSMREVQEYAEMAQTELARVTEITLQTLRFHRQQTKAVEIELTELARTVMALYTGRLLVRNITLEWKLQQAPKVWCLEGEVRQVLNNLVRNALDAMASGGQLSLRVHPQREWLPDGVAREGVRMTVADTGEGISPRMAGRLFEPFQTTKENTGTGLGLWVSKGIVEKHGGRIRARSRTGARHGTVFSVWLPVDGGITLTSQQTD